jgi:exodeoxyribonuclease VII large subunit
MFRSSAARVKFQVEDGLAVVIKGRVSLYEKDGQYQFYAEEMHPVGEGDLALQFKQVKEKLEREGLFNTESKRSLPKFPKRIAVITSDTGAAIRDILNLTSTRYPACEIVMCPVLVQGELAAQNMVNTLDRVYKLDDIDTIIIGRGGGSSEDLHCFNDETLARKIFESPFPVISAVGHETDFTICDFVADVRASTPSHAAELAVPDWRALKNGIDNLDGLLKSKIRYKYDLCLNSLQSCKIKVSPNNLLRIIGNKQLDVDRISDKMSNKLELTLQNNINKASSLMARVDALSPLKVMARGFSVISKNGEYLTNTKKINIGDDITVQLNDGDIYCRVTDKNTKQR